MYEDAAAGSSVYVRGAVADISPTVAWPPPGAMSAPYYETDSEAEVEAEVAAWEEMDVPPPNWELRQIHLNQRRTAEEIFGSPVKRQRLQQLARAAVEKESTIAAVTATLKIGEGHPLRHVLRFLVQ